MGWSETGPSPRTMKQEVFELHELLQAAGVSGPLVLVGHSIGGLNARLYANAHGSDVAGMVLVDPAHESSVLYSIPLGRWARMRELASNRPVPEPSRQGRAPTQNDQNQNFLPEEFQALHVSRQRNPVPLADRPLIVIGAGKRPAPPGTSDSLWAILRQERDSQVSELAGLSRNSQFFLDTASGHGIPKDNPGLVARSILEVLNAIGNGTRVRLRELTVSAVVTSAADADGSWPSAQGPNLQNPHSLEGWPW
jgi:pimeloyl-ACP methyl ester carboxylesterase